MIKKGISKDMADTFEFSCEGLEELERDLEKVIKKCPAQAEATLKRLGRKFKKAAKERAEAELQSHERGEKEKKKAIREKWGLKVVDEDVGMVVLIWNSARHFHLIENGHQIVKDGKVVGFVRGYHIMEKTRADFQEIVPKQFQKMVKKILKENNLA